MVILEVVEKSPAYQRLQEMPGIGKILGLTIALETGDAKRFADAGHFASYCRCVKSVRQSNHKKKGKNNRVEDLPYRVEQLLGSKK